MASSNNGTRNKKQRRTVVIDNDSSSSLLLLPPVHVVSLSSGNMLQNFPDLLILILSYIADRTVFNAIAFSNRDIYKKSKAILPPWPIRYKLRICSSPPLMTWSPCGTRIACRFNCSNILLHDQRRGPFHDNENNFSKTGWSAHDEGYIHDLKFSPDGSFLVSTSFNSIVKLWDNGTGYYELLQEWNIKEEVTGRWSPREVSCYIDVSPCSKYIIVALSSGNRILFKSVDDGGKTIKCMMPQPIMKCITKIRSSVDDHAVFICGKEDSSNDEVVMLWRPYLDDADKDIGSFITLWRNHQFRTDEFLLSRDNTMIAMYDIYRNEGRILSFDRNKNCQTQMFIISRNVKLQSLLYFTPDNKYILCYTLNNGLKYWSVAESKVTEKEQFVYTKNFIVLNASPNNRQFFVRDKSISYDHYIIPFFGNEVPMA